MYIYESQFDKTVCVLPPVAQQFVLKGSISSVLVREVTLMSTLDPLAKLALKANFSS